MTYSTSKNFAALALATALTVMGSACARADKSAGGTEDTANRSARPPDAATRQPTIEASPVSEGEGGWKVAAGDQVTFTVGAPGAKEVKLLYRPVISNDRFVELGTAAQPTGQGSGTFQARIRIPEDFAGEVWARATYPGGAKQTETINITTQTAISPRATARQTAGESSPANATQSDAIGADESLRSDKATGGRIVRTSLKEGQGEIKITLNVPAFMLTLWQNGKEVKTYPVGVGRKAFPVPTGERAADRIILNPAWIPPDSAWVRQSSAVEPYERIPADDPRNPLGKIKIPLGDAYLIHEAAEPSDIGNLVSHGCIRMLEGDLFDLTRKIASARRLRGGREKIEQARNGGERVVLDLDEPLPVDINYDTHVVEAGVLHLYPDVYERDTNTADKLREELQSNAVDASRIDDMTLRRMLERVSSEQLFTVSIADIKAGRALERGKTEPLTPQQVERDQKVPRKGGSADARGT